MKCFRNISVQKIDITIKNVTKDFVFHDLKKQIVKTFVSSTKMYRFTSLLSWKYLFSTIKEIL